MRNVSIASGLVLEIKKHLLVRYQTARVDYKILHEKIKLRPDSTRAFKVRLTLIVVIHSSLEFLDLAFVQDW
jgi:hypothetical protein